MSPPTNTTTTNFSRLGVSPGYSKPSDHTSNSPGLVDMQKPWLTPKRLMRLTILAEIESLDAEAAEVLKTIRGLV